MKPEPDMQKVAAAVAALEARQNARLSKSAAAKATAAKDHRTYPPAASPIAQDAAIRKPLRSHGRPCSGFNCSHFLNRD
jgi:hypothetical protein